MSERYWLNCQGRSYDVVDRLRQPQEVLAVVTDPVDGERLVRLLNEDEQKKGAKQ